MSGKDRDRSWSEVGDTLRYFNSMASSRSWCCADTDDSDLALIGLNQLDLPIEGAAMATAAAKAVAVVAAVSCDNFDDHDDCTIQMGKKFSTASLGVSKAEVVELW